jgi:hypothetical protein
MLVADFLDDGVERGDVADVDFLVRERGGEFFFGAGCDGGEVGRGGVEAVEGVDCAGLGSMLKYERRRSKEEEGGRRYRLRRLQVKPLLA